MKVIVDLGHGQGIYTPIGETIRYHEGDLDSMEILWCDSHKGRYGIHLPSKLLVYLPVGTPGAAALPPNSVRSIRRNGTNVTGVPANGTPAAAQQAQVLPKKGKAA